MRFFCSLRFTYYFIFCGVLWTSFSLQAKSSLVTQAIAALEREDFEQAKTHIDQAVEETTVQGQGGVWYYRGVIYEKLLRSQAATEDAPQLFEATITAYQKALSLTSVCSQYHSFAKINLSGLWAYFLDRGRRYYRQEVFEKAIQQLQHCKQIKPEDPHAYLYTAIAAHQQDEYELALNNYELYLEKVHTENHTIPAAVYRGIAHLTASVRKDPQKALEIVERALLLYPFDHDLCCEQLQIYARLGQVEVLSELLKKKTEVTPQEATLHYQLGYCNIYQGQEKQALQQYGEATKCAPERIEPICQQGIIYYNQAARLTQEIKEMPEDKISQELCKEKMKQMEIALHQSLSYLEQAYKLSSREPFMIKHLYNLYLRLRKPAKADKMARRLRKYGG